jgi:hypothetical protein
MISADGPGGTYELLGRSYGIEVPDCGHMVPHMTEDMDADLGKMVFVFHAHVNQDDDRCGKTDRQRTELRGKGGGVNGPQGSTRYYRWKFKLPTGFQTSGNFTHIFQIKAYGNGHGSGAPIMTLTPRNATFAIDGRIGAHGTTALSKFLGNWVVVDLKILHTNAGRVEATIKNLKTGEMLFNYAGNHDMWDDGAVDGMPKFGIYRGLLNKGALRDEQVRFADFCVSDTSAAECADGMGDPTPPPPAADAGAPGGGRDGGTGGDPGQGGGEDPPPARDAGASADTRAADPEPTPSKPDAGGGSSMPKPPTVKLDGGGSDEEPPDDENPDPNGPTAARPKGGCSTGGGSSGLAAGLVLLALAATARALRRRPARARR